MISCTDFTKYTVKCKVYFTKFLFFFNSELPCPAFSFNHKYTHNALQCLDEKHRDEDHLEGPDQHPHRHKATACRAARNIQDVFHNQHIKPLEN